MSLCGSLVVVVLVLFLAGPPLLTCWTGVGPPPEPSTSECLVRKWNALSAFDRLQLEQPFVALALAAVVGFVATWLLIRLVSAVRRPRPR